MISRQRILITGANGFIGPNLCATLKEKGYFVWGAVRNNVRDVSGLATSFRRGGYGLELDLFKEAFTDSNL